MPPKKEDKSTATLPAPSSAPVPSSIPSPDPSASINALTTLMQTMSNSIQALHSKIADLEQRAQPVQQPQVYGPIQGMPNRVPAPSFLTGANGGFNDEEYYARIKPHNPKIGHVRMYQYFDELGRRLKGGTGLPGDIPEWILIPRDLAQKLAMYRQREDDPRSPPVLDIVTRDEYYYINEAEELHRKAQLGLAGVAPTMLMNESASNRVRARAIDGRSPDSVGRGVPSITPGAEQFMQRQQQYPQAVQYPQYAQYPQQVATPSLIPTPPLPPSMQGRMQALQGLATENNSGITNTMDDTSSAGLDLVPEALADPAIAQLVQESHAYSQRATAELGRDPMRPR